MVISPFIWIDLCLPELTPQRDQRAQAVFAQVQPRPNQHAQIAGQLDNSEWHSQSVRPSSLSECLNHWSRFHEFHDSAEGQKKNYQATEDASGAEPRLRARRGFKERWHDFFLLPFNGDHYFCFANSFSK